MCTSFSALLTAHFALREPHRPPQPSALMSVGSWKQPTDTHIDCREPQVYFLLLFVSCSLSLPGIIFVLILVRSSLGYKMKSQFLFRSFFVSDFVSTVKSKTSVLCILIYSFESYQCANDRWYELYL